jgi:homoserine O-succinyltransferase
MVVNMDTSRFSHGAAAGNARSSRRALWTRAERPGPCVTIGLVNNMAGSAFQATERQFLSLLDAASESIPIQVSFYTLPGVSRAESGGERFASHYAGIDALLNTRLDAIIVTGREPKMADLCDEPYWKSFTEVLEWAQSNTYSALWSCLAAHAAILHMDGIGRRKGDEKHFGVFECLNVCEHPLTEGLPARFHVPHSRWNGIVEQDLASAGYRVLSRVAGNGVDTFVKQDKSLFVFFQGHLEYEPDTLMREYRRDVGRFIRGEANTYPLLPRDYFDSSTEQALAQLRDSAASVRSKTEMLHRVTGALDSARIEDTWQRSASLIYRNWLQCIWAQKNAGKHRAVPAVSLSR